MIDFTLYLIADPSVIERRLLPDIVRAALSGGVTVVQYRDKTAPDDQFYKGAVEIHDICKNAGVPFILNDRVDVAVAMKADGVHVGREDMAVGRVRDAMGPAKVVGVSAHTIEEAREAEAGGCTYLGCGSVFPTTTKQNIRGILGIEGVRRIATAVQKPVVAIGGIHPDNAPQLRDTGIAGMAVISAILLASDPRRAAVRLRAAVGKPV